MACIHTPEWCPGLDSMNYTLSRLFTPVTWCEGRGAVTDRFGRHPQMWPPVNCEYLLEASIVHGDVTRPTALSWMLGEAGRTLRRFACHCRFARPKCCLGLEPSYVITNTCLHHRRW